jgi:hypothetical protein
MNLFHRTQRTHQPSASASRARRQRRQRPGLEALEGRQLLSLTAQFQVNTRQGLADNNSDTASSPSGLKVVVWEDAYSNTDHDIYAQMYNPDGSRHGGQITVEYSSAFQSNPRVAMDANGDFVVVYQENTRNISSNPYSNNYIIAKVYDSNGNSTTGRIQVSDSFVDSQHSFDDQTPDVAMDSSGDFVVAYEQDVSSTQSNIGGAEYNRLGTLIGLPNIANPNGHFQFAPSVAMTPDGRYDIAYQDRQSLSVQPNIRLARYGEFGDQLSDQELSSTLAGAWAPSVSMDNAGNAMVAYQKVFEGGSGKFFNNFDIEVDRITSNGFELGGPAITETGIAYNNPGFASDSPDIALDPNGTGIFVVSFETQLLGATQGNRTVQIDEVNASGNIIYWANLAAYPNNYQPAVSLDANGGYMMPFTANLGRGTVPEQVWAVLGHLPSSPAAKDLKLTPTVQLGQLATLTGSLTDASGDKNLTLTVNWGDGSKPDQSKPGLKPFAVTHKYDKAGTYKVHATWSDDHGLSRSRDLVVTVDAPKTGL